MVQRVIGFDKQDWRHVRFLSGNMVKQFFIGNIGESVEAWYFLKLHFAYDSERVEPDAKK